MQGILCPSKTFAYAGIRISNAYDKRLLRKHRICADDDHHGSSDGCFANDEHDAPYTDILVSYEIFSLVAEHNLRMQVLFHSLYMCGNALHTQQMNSGPSKQELSLDLSLNTPSCKKPKRKDDWLFTGSVKACLTI